jgi:hypothetical protein
MFISRKTLIVAIFTVSLVGCGSDSKVAGLYEGVIPAADCPGIKIELMLRDNGRYTMNSEYLERDISFSESGGYSVSGDTVSLSTTDGDAFRYRFLKSGGNLRMLDADGHTIDGVLKDNYTLTRSNK